MTGRVCLLSVTVSVDILPSTETQNFMLDTKVLIRFIKLAEKSNFDNLYSKTVCHVVSKAFSTSKNTAALGMLLLLK
jgi:hypothetical protein